MRQPPLRTLATAASALVLLAGGLAVPWGAAPAGADARSERAQVQRERAAVAADIDTLRATDAEVEAALEALRANVAGRTAELRDAERAAERAEAEVAAATERVQAKRTEIAVLDEAVKQAVVAAYVSLPSTAGVLESLTASSIGEAEVKRSLLAVRQTDQLDLLDELQRAREDLEVAQAEAEAAAEAAQGRRAEVATQLDEVTRAQEQQEGVVADVQARLDRRLAEAQSLAELDAELAAQIEAEQRRIAEELARQQAAQQAAAERAAEAARRTAAAAPAPTTPRRQAPSRPAAPESPSAPAAPAAPIGIVGSGSIVSVRGIRVHTSIASNLADMLGAAEAAGISLAGGGYRDPAGQIAVRRANCGTSYYAVYQMPASQCRPPTARPGTSMHEQGLAIDFTHGGRIISSRGSAAFQWLASNASRYGFYNLPSEPWHWSVNGR